MRRTCGRTRIGATGEFRRRAVVGSQGALPIVVALWLLSSFVCCNASSDGLGDTEPETAQPDVAPPDGAVVDADAVSADAQDVESDADTVMQDAERDGTADTEPEAEVVDAADLDVVLDPDDATDVAEDLERDDVVEDVAFDVSGEDIEHDAPDSDDGDVRVADAIDVVPPDDADVDDTSDVVLEFREDGAPCDADTQCAGGTCLAAPEFPGGYCTTLDCSTFEDCTSVEGNNRCWRATSMCMRICETSNDCRDGYVCADFRFGEGRCYPPGGSAPDVMAVEEGIDVSCGHVPGPDGLVELEFTIEEGTSSFMIVPFGLDLSDTLPTQVTPPVHPTVPFYDWRDARVDSWRLFGWLNPLVFPYTLSTIDEFAPGDWTLQVESLAREVCFYVVTSDTPGRTVDLRVTLVGANGLTTASIAGDAEGQRMIAELRRVFDGSEVGIGEVEFVDASPDVVEAYRIIRTRDDVEALFATTTQQGVAPSESLAVEVFLVDNLSITGAIVEGTSGGLPGPFGLPGTNASGIAATTEYLRRIAIDRTEGPEFTGRLIAHELGHYLGLRHTSEDRGQSIDEVADTPSCLGGAWPAGCPDRWNLMFEILPEEPVELTPGQQFQLSMNPYLY